MQLAYQHVCMYRHDGNPVAVSMVTIVYHITAQFRAATVYQYYAY